MLMLSNFVGQHFDVDFKVNKRKGKPNVVRVRPLGHIFFFFGFKFQFGKDIYVSIKKCYYREKQYIGILCKFRYGMLKISVSFIIQK